LQDLHGIDRAAAQLHVDPVGVGIVAHHFEEADRAVRLAVYRTADVEHIFQVFELDGAIDAEVRTRAQGKRIVDAHINGYGTVDNRRIDADHETLDDSRARGPRGVLADDDIFRLRFGDFNLRLEVFRVGHARQVRSDG